MGGTAFGESERMGAGGGRKVGRREEEGGEG